MQSHLHWLALTALLGACLWIPFVVGRVMTFGFPKAQEFRDLKRQESPAWVKRCDRALMNFVESFAPFAVLVIVAHLAFHTSAPAMMGKIALWAQVFFWARLAHAIVFWLGIPFIRSVVFTVGFVATIMIALTIWRIVG